MARLAIHPSQSAGALSQIDSEHVSLRTWLCVLGVLMGCFMSVLNIVVTNSSLLNIAGTLGASSDEISWVPTAYLVAEIIVIPLTAWLVSVFSLRNYLFVNSILFVFFSVCCGQARSLDLMILFRVCQGFTGGVLIPLTFVVILQYLPRSKHPIGIALFSVTTTFAPAIGPLIGGWLTDNYGWPYIFYMNVGPGMILIAAVWFLDKHPLNLSLLKKADWWGILTMAAGLAALEVVLENGNRKDWFGDPLILKLAWTALLSITAFVIIELRGKDPLIDLRLFARRNFGAGCAVNLLMGIGLYGAVYILPIYMAQIHGYSAFQIGTVIIWLGLPQLLVIPIVPILMMKFDARWLIGIGIVLFGGGCFLTSHLSMAFAGPQFHLSLFIRAVGQPLIMVPLASVATAGMAKGRESGAASALYNMMVNLGGSFGIAGLATLLSVRERFHSVRVGESVSLYSEATQSRLDEATTYFMAKGSDEYSAHLRALGSLGGIVRREAFLQAFSDCFLVLGCVLVASIVAVFFMQKAAVSEGPGAAH
jgi:DHA2 family multidrug resistance protein